MNYPCRPSFYPFPEVNCGSSQWGGPVGPYPCRPHFPCVRKDFVTPAAQSPVNIELTDTEALTTGQGILIGSAFYIITDIIDSLIIQAYHNGVGADVGTTIIAVHPSYGCYQYPVIPAGKVSLDTTPSLAGLNAAADTAISSVLTIINVDKLTYGYLGPTTIDFQAEVTAEIANTPYWIAIALPRPVRTSSPYPVFSALIEDGGSALIGVAKTGTGSYANYAVVGKSGGSQFTNGAGRRVLVSGKYEIDV